MQGLPCPLFQTAAPLGTTRLRDLTHPCVLSYHYLLVYFMHSLCLLLPPTTGVAAPAPRAGVSELFMPLRQDLGQCR